MSAVTVVTTLHEDGYKLYGQSNLQTWSSLFPKEWKIKYYSEKHKPELSPRVEVLDFDQTCPEWQDFYSAVKDRFNNENDQDEKRKNWYKKALRWSFKMYTVLHALKNCDSKYLVWIDADVKAAKSPDAKWIEKCLKNTCVAAQLEFIKAGGHIETGILIFDREHKDIQKVYDWIYKGYVDHQILDEGKPWDGIWMAKLLKGNTIAWNNLTMVTKKDLALAFSHKDLQWLVHGVGKRKFNKSLLNVRSGRTNDNELI
jgi:hypothetical protein